MLVGNLIFLEQIRHFFGHHRIIVLNGDEGDFFSRLGRLHRRGLFGLFRCVTHSISIHQQSLGLLDLFEGFQRRFLRKLPFAALAGDEVDRFSDGQRSAEVEIDSAVVTGRARNLL